LALAALTAVIMLSLAACGTRTSGGSSTSTTEHVAQQGAETKTKPTLTISNKTSSSSVIIESVLLPEGGSPGVGGWVVVGRDASGKIGSVLGSAQINEGVNQNVTVHMNPPLSAGTYLVGLYAGKKTPTVGERSLIVKPFSIAAG
jgi:hypothetical protein